MLKRKGHKSHNTKTHLEDTLFFHCEPEWLFCLVAGSRSKTLKNDQWHKTKRPAVGCFMGQKKKMNPDPSSCPLLKLPSSLAPIGLGLSYSQNAKKNSTVINPTTQRHTSKTLCFFTANLKDCLFQKVAPNTEQWSLTPRKKKQKPKKIKQLKVEENSNKKKKRFAQPQTNLFREEESERKS